MSPATRRAVVLLLAAGSLAYANAFWGGFQFDDEQVILRDARLQDLGRFMGHLPQMIRPVTKLTFFVERAWFGASPAGYHLLNLFLHLANGLLVFALLLGAAPRFRLAPTRTVAFWTALVFLVHPVGTEAVTYISGRPTLLATFFGLAALVMAARSASAPAPGASRSPAARHAMTAGVACGFALALLSKEVALVFPALLLLWHVVIGRSANSPAGQVPARHHLVAWITAASFCLVAAAHDRYVFLFRYSVGLRGWLENLLSQGYAVAYAVTLLIAPLPSRLNFDHDLPLVTALSQWPEPLCLAALAALLALALVCLRRAPVAAFGLLWFFIAMVPTNSVLPRYDLLSERNLYLPSIGVFIALVEGGRAAGARLAAWLPAADRPWTHAPFLVPIAVVLALASITVDRNRLYADPVAFWADAVRKSPGKARPHDNYGYALYRAGQVDRAIDEFRAALAIDRNDPDAQRNLRRAWTSGRRGP